MAFFTPYCGLSRRFFAAAGPQFRAAHAYDATILPKLDDEGDSVVDRVVFQARKK